MAITNFKKEEPQDNFDRHMCSAAGCQKRWSVKMEGSKPMCSNHQWSVNKPATARDIAALLPGAPVKHWQDDEAF